MAHGACVPLIGIMCGALLTTKLPILLGTDIWIFNVRELSRYGLLSALHEARTDLTVLAGLVVLAVAGPDRWSLDVGRRQEGVVNPKDDATGCPADS